MTPDEGFGPLHSLRGSRYVKLVPNWLETGWKALTRPIAAGFVAIGARPNHLTTLGLLLIVAFSVGLAAVLAGIGLVLVRARRLFERLPAGGRLARWVPVASAVVVLGAGAAVLVQALGQLGFSI